MSKGLTRLWNWLVRPSSRVQDPMDRRRSRLLASQLVVVDLLVLIGALLQALRAPDFLPVAPFVGIGWSALFFGYVLARKGAYEVAASIVATSIIFVCLAIVLVRPQDPVWEGFMTLAVLFASLFVSLRIIALLSAWAVAATIAAVFLTPELRAPGTSIPLVFYQVIMVAMIFLTRAHHAALDKMRREKDLAHQARLEQAKRVELLGRLAGGIAHDFNNVLQLVTVGASELKSSNEITLDDQEVVGDILEASERGSDLTKRLMMVAKEQQLEPGVFDLKDWLHQVVPTLERESRGRASLEFFYSEGVVKICADETQVRQVLDNLIRNAIAACPDAAVIRLRLEDTQLVGEDALELGCAPGRYAQLFVEDSGSGMDEQTLARIFDPFFTTRDAGMGTGLGLASVWAILQQQGGHISAESRLGEGSSFRVLWPLALGSAAQAEATFEAN
ncbi:MAG: ATP-binding protein [Polyangiaceae bacterium]|nr:ATP-binding protein [Polyangiaceae bacterium]